jgi:Tfp pilus assembly protein PilO
MNFERISSLLKSIRFVYVGLFLVVLNIIAFLFLVLPQKQNISRLQTDYAYQRSRMAEQKRGITVLSRRLEALQKAKRDLEVIYTQVLAQKKIGVTAIRQELQDLAGSLTVQRGGVDYNYIVLPEYGLRHFALSVPVEGAYRDIRRFINDIERSQYFLILDRVDLSTERKRDAGENVRLNFQISTYLRDEEIKDDGKYATRRPVSQP